MAPSKRKVLFLCTGNSARSQMAEGYLRQAAGSEFEALSAGVQPQALNPLAIEVMQEIGIDSFQCPNCRESIGTVVSAAIR